jgi:hypothetical protein
MPGIVFRRIFSFDVLGQFAENHRALTLFIDYAENRKGKGLLARTQIGFKVAYATIQIDNCL